MLNISTTELLIIGVLLLLFIGSKKMTEVARNAGEATKELKKAKAEFANVNEEIKKPVVVKEDVVVVKKKRKGVAK